MSTDTTQPPEAVGLIGGGLVVRDRSRKPPLIVYNPFNRYVATAHHYPQPGTQAYVSLKNAGCFDVKPPKWIERSLTLAVTENCNCRCSYCFQGTARTDRNMTSRTARSLIDSYLQQLPDGQRPVIAFYGGEPTQNMPLIEWCAEYLKSQGYDPAFSISTNGVMSGSSLRYVLKNRFYVALSMDGPPEIQDMHRPLKTAAASSPFVQDTLRGVLKEGLPFHVRTTITNLSVQRMPHIVDYFCNEGVRNIHVEPVEITGACEGAHTLRPSVDSFLEGFLQAAAVARRYGAIMNVVTLRYLKRGIAGHFCGPLAGYDGLYNVDGSRSLCHELLDAHELSAFLSTSPCETADSHDLCFEPIISNPMSPCFACHLKYVCGGTCPKQSWEETGAHAQPSSWHCLLSKKLIPVIVSEIARSTFPPGQEEETKGENYGHGKVARKQEGRGKGGSRVCGLSRVSRT